MRHVDCTFGGDGRSGRKRRAETNMQRHLLGLMWFGCFAGLACILTLLMNQNGLALSTLVVATVGFTVYVIGEGRFGDPFGHGDGKV